MTTPADGVPGFWEVVLALFSGTALSALTGGVGAIWLAGRKRGRDETSAKKLREEFDRHVVSDQAMFKQLEAKIDGQSERIEARLEDESRERAHQHEANLIRYGALSAQVSALPTHDMIDRRFSELGGLIREGLRRPDD